MKLVLTGLIAAMMAVPAFTAPVFDVAQNPIREGIKEVELSTSGFYFRGGDFQITAGAGMFINEDLLVGGRVEFYNFDGGNAWMVGAKAEYHWNKGARMVPYAGGLIYLADLDGESLFVYGPAGGVKYFLTESLVIDGFARYLLGSEDWYDDDIEAGIGFRWMF